MAKKLLFLYTYFLCANMLLSQEKHLFITGKVTDSIGVVTNVHILNINTKQGTFSNDKGNFEMTVKLGDSLQFSSVQHFTKIIYISNHTIKSKQLQVTLRIATIILDPFELKRHYLTGNLETDLQNVIHKKDSLLRVTMNLSNIDWDAPVADDYIDKKVRPPVVNTMAGAMPMIGGTSIGVPSKSIERERKLKKKLANKKDFPMKILHRLGRNYFFKTLKIPEEKYYHFLEYCNPLGIEDLFEKDKLLTIIKIFEEESKSYLKIIKK